jgi:hypothetical protein
MATLHVYHMRYWSKEEERPWINFELPQNGKNIPWREIGEVLDGKMPVSNYKPLRLVVNEEEPEQWHSYNVPGTYGLLSKTAVTLMGSYMTRCFEFLEAWINDLPFYFLRKIGSLDCLDRANSVLVPYPHDPSRVMDIERYRFVKEMIRDPIVFIIPEEKGWLLATDSVKAAVESAGLKGFYFTDAEL